MTLEGHSRSLTLGLLDGADIAVSVTGTVTVTG